MTMNKKAGGNNGLTVLHGKAWLFAAVCSVTVLAGAAGAPIVGINEDNENFFVTRPEEEMTEACAEAYIDSLAGGKITHVFMCPSGQRTSYDSKAWEPIWAMMDEPGGAIPPGSKALKLPQTHRWAKNAKLLHDRGVDLYKVWIRRCRMRGLSPWLSPRMNDIHHVDREWPHRNTTFWRTRTDLHCATNAIGRGPFCYAHQEVQDYVFSLMKELIDRYDMDGLELDFMRQARCFEEIDAIGQSHHLDRFIKRVRDYLVAKGRERGRNIQLGVRVPTTPRSALACGYDVGKWAREGWVDLVCASTGWRTPDYNMPVDEWRKSFGEAAGRVKLLAGTDHGVTAYNWNRTDMTPELYAGFADVEWGNGVDGLYLFNAIYLYKAFQEVKEKGLFPDDILKYRQRRYPVSFRDLTGGVVPEDRQIPRLSDRPNSFSIRLGRNPVGVPSVLVGVLQEGEFNPEVTLNGVKPTRSQVEDTFFRNFDHPERSKTYYCRRYFFPKGSVHPGADNKVDFKPTKEKKSIVWVEIGLEGEK